MAQFRDLDDVKFFVVNNETTAAFTSTSNTFSSAYPNATFDNTSPVNLTTLSTNYEIKPPLLLGDGNDGTINSNKTVTSTTSGFFDTCGIGDYLFTEDTGIDSLIMLGKIVSKQSPLQVTLETLPGNITYTLGGNNEDRSIYHLHKNSPGLPFKSAESFYMVVKNPDYDDDDNAGLHNAIPYIDSTQTSASADVFAYGGSLTLNTTYFALVYISTINDSTAGLTNAQIQYGAASIPCTLTPISTLSQQTSTPSSGVTQEDIPYWSVYLVNPYGNNLSFLPKNTSYRAEIAGNIPVRKLQLSPANGNGVPGGTPIE